MSDWKTAISRRPFLAGAIAAAAAAAIGGGAYEAGLFRPRPKGPYGDLLSSLDDLSDAPIVGLAYLTETENFNEKAVAAQLRTRLSGQSLGDALNTDITGNQIAEAGGWVLPETLALLCALAAVNK
jgi:ABC-type glycerol-3-phosphate transport system substrate-binding protein